MKKIIVIGIILLFIEVSVVFGFNTNSTNNPQPMNRGWLYVGGSGDGNYIYIQDVIDNFQSVPIHSLYELGNG